MLNRKELLIVLALIAFFVVSITAAVIMRPKYDCPKKDIQIAGAESTNINHIKEVK